MYLTVVRHAIAAERDPGAWPNDTDRPLTDAGIERFRGAARGLRKIAGTPDLVLSSPLERCRSTCAILAEEGGWPLPETTDALAPGGSVQAILTELERMAGSHNQVAVVGHEPNLGLLIAALLHEDADRSFCVLKKGGAARVDVEGTVEPGSGTLRWLLTPRVLRALS